MRKSTEQLLTLSAPIANILARQYCSEGTCDWYHGIWQYLRLFGVISTISSSSRFLQESFARAGLNRQHRILVSATADYGIVDLLHQVYTESMPEITVVDRCETPLQLCHWYAEQQDFELQTTVSDILEYSPENAAYDLITTHSFIGRFTLQQRPILFQHWHSLLKPEGQLITAVRIRKEQTRSEVIFGQDEANQFVARARQLASAYATEHTFDQPQFKHWLDQYVARRKSHVINNEEELLDQLERSGFRIEALERASKAQIDNDQPSGPQKSSPNSYRLCIVASRI